MRYPIKITETADMRLCGSKVSLPKLLPSSGILLLTIAAFVLRLVNIDRGLWYDEGFSGYLSRLDWIEIVSFLAGKDVHPPLYFLLAQVWASSCWERAGPCRSRRPSRFPPASTPMRLMELS